MKTILINGSEIEIESIKAGIKDIVELMDENDIDLLENYILKWGIKGKPWENDFVLEDKNLEKINIVRKLIITPIVEFKNDLIGRKTVKEMVEALFHFLVKLGVILLIFATTNLLLINITKF